LNKSSVAVRPETTRMFAEAAEAPAAVTRMLAANREAVQALGEALRRDPPPAVVTCARGSSDHAATYAKYLIETGIGVPTSSAALSVSSLYDATPRLEGALFLAISHSGRSPDLLATLEAAKRGGARTVALVNDESSPLAALADLTLPLKAGPETSVAATKSYITALAGVAQLVAAWTPDPPLAKALDDLPAILAQAWTLDWSLDWSPAVARLKGATNLYVLGRGPGFAIAQEAALKFKETCGLHAEAFSAAEVLHGPMALVGEGFPVLVFAQADASEAGVLELVAALEARGAQVLLAGGPGSNHLPTPSAHPVLEPIARIQGFYRMANALAVARGLDPDSPPHLRKVTETV
jgi:glucosamine--fructose-6-phosphate aminotransferase (isomerizing)